MHMVTKKRTIKQISEDTGVSYRTMLAWNKSRPELMDYLFKYDIDQATIARLTLDIAALKSLISHVHESTRG